MLVLLVVAVSGALDTLPGIYVTTPFWADQSLFILAMGLFAGSAWCLQKLIAEITALQGSLVNVSATFA